MIRRILAPALLLVASGTAAASGVDGTYDGPGSPQMRVVAKAVVKRTTRGYRDEKGLRSSGIGTHQP